MEISKLRHLLPDTTSYWTFPGVSLHQRIIKIGKTAKIIKSNHWPITTTPLNHVTQWDIALFLDTSWDGDPTTSLGALFQYLTITLMQAGEAEVKTTGDAVEPLYYTKWWEKLVSV